MRSSAEMIFGRLLDNDVRFVVIGAIAATLHGSYLRTDDIDICPAPEIQNLEKLARTLNELGAREWDPRKGEVIPRAFTAEMLAEDRLWLLVVDDYELDLVFEPVATAGFSDLDSRATSIDLGSGRELRIASLDDLIRSKEALGRTKDQDHLNVLRRLRDGSST